MLDFLEALATHKQVVVWSCQTEMIKMYERRGFKAVRSVPVSEMGVPRNVLKRTDVRAVTMEKDC